jgi:enoyl-CoA hydratase
VTKLQKVIPMGEFAEIDGCRLSDAAYAAVRGSTIYKPISAAINRPCVAGEMETLGGVAIRVAIANASFGVMKLKRGLFAGCDTTVRLPRQLAFPAVMEFLLTAVRFPAERALELGLLNESVPEAEPREKAFDWASRITANAPLAVQATQESVMHGLSLDLDGAYEVESKIASEIFQVQDAQEGPKAFAEKREPKWRAR